MVARVLTAVLLVIVATASLAQSNAQAVERAAQLARDSCNVSSVQGVRTNETGNRVVKLPGSQEEVTLTDERWKGIQQVLREHQRDDSANYRDCVRDLTPQFLAALNTPDPRPDPLLCDFENDGVCDVPGLCPQGTDVADCSSVPQVNFPPQPLYCCDIYGRKWCQMTSGVQVAGAPCFCAGVVGSGYQCY